MILGGFLKTSFIDYPGKISSVVFTKGCNFKCHFCHNPELVITKDKSHFPIQKVFDYLESRKGKIEALVITGGEPTLHKDLPGFISDVKDIGLEVKLDTNGTHPEMISELVNDNLLDYVAMDIKAPFEINKYKDIVGIDLTEKMFSRIKETYKILKEGKVNYEFRTTASPDFLSLHDLRTIIKHAHPFNNFSVQNFNNAVVLDERAKNYSPFKEEELCKLKSDLLIDNINILIK